MKKILVFIIGMLMFSHVFAQKINEFEFVGVPVNGTKAELTLKLKDKGFICGSKDGSNEVQSTVLTGKNQERLHRIIVFPENLFYNRTEVIVASDDFIQHFKSAPKYREIKNQVERKAYDTEEEKFQAYVSAAENHSELFPKGIVWIKIFEQHENYVVVIYYKNWDIK